MTDETNKKIRDLDNALTKIADLVDQAVIQAQYWMDEAKILHSQVAVVSVENKARMLSAYSDMAAVSLRLAELHQKTYINARHERNQEALYERVQLRQEAEDSQS